MKSQSKILLAILGMLLASQMTVSVSSAADAELTEPAAPASNPYVRKSPPVPVTNQPKVSAEAPEVASTEKNDNQTLDARVQTLKKEVKALNRDLFILEEELLFPSSTQVAIFLSIDVGKFFRLDSVQLKIDDKIVANHLYTKRELGALERGGVQRLYMGNVKSGEHELVASFRGPGPNNREYKRATTIKFKKSSAAKFMELKIMDASRKLQPEFVVKEWE